MVGNYFYLHFHIGNDTMLAKRIYYFIETEGGRTAMCKAVEELAKGWADESRIDTLSVSKNKEEPRS